MTVEATLTATAGQADAADIHTRVANQMSRYAAKCGGVTLRFLL